MNYLHKCSKLADLKSLIHECSKFVVLKSRSYELHPWMFQVFGSETTFLWTISVNIPSLWISNHFLMHYLHECSKFADLKSLSYELSPWIFQVCVSEITFLWTISMNIPSLRLWNHFLMNFLHECSKVVVLKSLSYELPPWIFQVCVSEITFLWAISMNVPRLWFWNPFLMNCLHEYSKFASLKSLSYELPPWMFKVCGSEITFLWTISMNVPSLRLWNHFLMNYLHECSRFEVLKSQSYALSPWMFQVCGSEM